jgi:hypothetical protein
MTDEQEFDVFYKAYPRKVAKGDARKAWQSTKKIRPPLANILAALQAQCSTEQWLKDNHAYIPYPATWLRAERWDDEIEVTIAGKVIGKDWHETWTGITMKGNELGIFEKDFDHPIKFKQAVYEAARAQEAAARNNVFQLKSA